MNKYLLLPNRFKRIGWILIIPATLAGIVLIVKGYDVSWLHAQVFSLVKEDIMGSERHFFVLEQVDLANTIIGAAFIIGALMVAFSKEKKEDEYINNLRLSSLLWSVWVSYVLLLFAFLFIYGSPFLNVMIYNMFTVLIIFIIRFNFILYKNSKMATDEK